MTDLKETFKGCIMIGGCPRSGTTFLGKQLSERIGGLFIPEAPFKMDLIFCYKKGYDLRRTLETVWDNPRFRIWGIDKVCFFQLADKVDWSPKLLFGWICSLYQIKIGQSQAEYVVDHTPQNIHWYNSIQPFFENVLFINIYRDPRAVYNSVKVLDWGPNEAKSFYTWWVKNIAIGLLLNHKDPLRVQSIKFEDLIMDSDSTLQKLLCKMPFEIAGKLHASTIKIPNYTNAQHLLVHKGPQLNRVDGWKTELDQEEISFLESKLGFFIENFQYEFVTSQNFKMTSRFYLKFLYRKHFLGFFKSRRQRNRLKTV